MAEKEAGDFLHEHTDSALLSHLESGNHETALSARLSSKGMAPHAQSRKEAFEAAQKKMLASKEVKTPTNWRKAGLQKGAMMGAQSLTQELDDEDQRLSEVGQTGKDLYKGAKEGAQLTKKLSTKGGRLAQRLTQNIRNAVRFGKNATGAASTTGAGATTGGAAATAGVGASGGAAASSAGAGVGGATAGAAAGGGAIAGGLVALVVAVVVVILLVIGLAIGSAMGSQKNGKAPPGVDAAELARAQAVITNLKAQGGTPQGIAAILGCWQEESSITSERYEGDYLHQATTAEAEGDAFNPDTIFGSGWPEILHGDLLAYFAPALHQNVLGIGLGQWTGPRGASLMAFAASKQTSAYDMGTQLDFMTTADGPYDVAAFKAVLTSTSSNEGKLVSDFLTSWEGVPGNKLPERTKDAEDWLAYMTAPPTASGQANATVPDGWSLSAPPPSAETEIGGYPGNNYAGGQCTWYVYNRYAQLGVKLANGLGDGGYWGSNAPRFGYQTSTQPEVGWTASFPPGVDGSEAPTGHCAYVEAVRGDGSFLVSEMNYNGGLYKVDYRVIPSPQGVIFFHP